MQLPRAHHYISHQLLVAGYQILMWYMPHSGEKMKLQSDDYDYYGVAYMDDTASSRILVVARSAPPKPDQLLVIDPTDGRCIDSIEMQSSDTHNIVRNGLQLYVTDTFNGRILVYSLVDYELIAEYPIFNRSNHVNSLIVRDGLAYVLCHNLGASSLVEIDLQSSTILPGSSDEKPIRLKKPDLLTSKMWWHKSQWPILIPGWSKNSSVRD